jgi:hypothetical protein
LNNKVFGAKNPDANLRDNFLRAAKAQVAPQNFRAASEALGLRHFKDPRQLRNR